MITLPQGFTAAGTTAGIKPSGNPDMALVRNLGPRFSAAAVFTRNRIIAAPVKVTKENVADGVLRAVVFNSGNANACTGPQGEADVRATIAAVAEGLGVAHGDVGVCSTGLIGEPLPMEAVLAGVPDLVGRLGGTPEHANDAAIAIMTTDTVQKQALFEGSGWSVGGMAKGVGMMAPSLATMLVLLTTDANVPAEMLNTALKAASATTFDCVDIDGSTSTNDTVILMASGASGIVPTQEELNKAVWEVCDKLAAQMQADAEGVTKRVTITVTGTTTDAMALNAARTIARDNLFKCAMFGSDPNWGRTLVAVGMADADMDGEKISASFNGQPVCLNSTPVPGGRDVDLSAEDIEVHVDLGTGGGGKATVRTTDLSLAYVDFNSAYTT